MDPEYKTIPKGFFLRWVIFTIVGVIVGLSVGAFGDHFVNKIYIGDKNIVLGFILGATVGLAQLMVLEKRITIKGSWMLPCSIGMGLPFIVDVILIEAGIKFHDLPYSFIVIGTVGGFIAGLFQWRVFSPHSEIPGLWIIASPIGWGLCFASIKGPLGLAGNVILGAVALSLTTGIVVMMMLKSPEHYEQFEEDPQERNQTFDRSQYG
ncbi:MAG: hypothetical protein P9X24_07305 [Candidatus Hatepunaea meridiana]|nr:hypothetical protein [Candidatus Hatepunaea meridiana]